MFHSFSKYLLNSHLVREYSDEQGRLAKDKERNICLVVLLHSNNLALHKIDRK